MKKIFLVLLIATVFIAGCTQQQPPPNHGGQPEQTLYFPPNGTASLKIISPHDGDVINSTGVGIHANVTGFRLVDIMANRPNVQNEGHIDYFLDDKVQKTKYTSTSFQSVPPGQHVIRAELRNNDDSPLVPAVTATVTITTQ
jgi:hypothetical protein